MRSRKKTRKELDDAAEKLKGKPDAAAQLDKLSQKQRKGIEAQGKILRTMDPTGGNSNIGTDHDVSLNLLANDYPAALAAAMAGDEKPLAEVRAELDKRDQEDGVVARRNQTGQEVVVTFTFRPFGLSPL